MIKTLKNIGDPQLSLYTLMFRDKELEFSYRKSNINRHFLSQRIILLTAILFFASFAFYDYAVQPYEAENIIFMRLGIFSPILLALWIISSLQKGRDYHNLLSSLIVIFTAAGISYVIFHSPFSIADNYTYGLVLTLIFGFILVDIRFLSSVINYAAISAVYFIILGLRTNIPQGYVTTQVILFISLGFTLIVGRYTIEFYKRIDFLTRKKLEEEKTKVKQAFQREKLLNDAKGRFTNVIAHVFRTPLATIQNSIHIIEHKAKLANINIHGETDLLIRSTENIAYSIERAQFIIKFDSGKIFKNLSTFSIPDLVKEVTQEIIRLESLNKTFRISIDEDCSLVTSDRNLLKHILTNYVSNAAKFSRRNSDITIHCKRESDDYLLFQVTDTGYGIPEEQLLNIFEVYYHFSSDPMIMGLGLGLAIIKRCADMLEAEVWLESEDKKGTKAFLRLPINS